MKLFQAFSLSLRRQAMLATIAFSALGTAAQTGNKGQVYDDFEGSRLLHYGERTGVLDSAVKNPAPGSVNSSSNCGLYVRNSSRKFANIKMPLHSKLVQVEQYATYDGEPPRIRMKVYTTAPPGTLIEILLGSRKGNNDYPAGTHSQYQAYTTKSGEWEELEFKFSQIPQGSETNADQVDQITLLFNPNSSTSDTYYFDDITGPPMVAVPSTQGKKKSMPQAGAGQVKKAATKTSSGK